MYKKLFIPGPTHVRDEILQAQAEPMIGHRAKEYAALQAEVTPKLQKMLYTDQIVFLFASSSTGVMEGAVRNLTAKKVLNTICGAFGRRWHEITKANGIPCDVLEVEPGHGITPELVDKALAAGGYDAMTIVMNETSTGVMNPLGDIGRLVYEKYPEVMVLVDAVSCMAGVKIEFDAWHLDVCLAGVQKCFALPPGLTVCAVSQRALEKCATVPNRGYYFDFAHNYKYYQKNQTPATPAISLIQALNKQMDDILAEGLEERWQRHVDMAEVVREWADKYWAMFPQPEFYSNTLSCIKNTRRINVAEMNAELGKRGAMISNGYGPFKEKTFRIAHMGDLTVDDMRWVTAQIGDILGLEAG
ncbi:MAG TPA: alanine--glyoxylate aminotransferase family protein [Anaerolineae bacterium]|nr:alanine--glyoxylate aminotransferase family protein [Anaerolineae bacterium]